MPLTDRLHKDQNAQRLCVKHLNGSVYETTTGRVPNDFNLGKVDDVEVNVLPYLCNDVELYQPSPFGIEWNNKLPS